DLSQHVESVVQTCLRNQFATLAEYNAQAGEMAEPFRFLVVANFPTHFSTEMARRLAALAARGARCGLHVLVTVDTNAPLPQDFHLKELEQPSVTLVWQDGRFRWRDDDFGQYPLRADAPPAGEPLTYILREAGEASRLANRIEVPF